MDDNRRDELMQRVQKSRESRQKRKGGLRRLGGWAFALLAFLLLAPVGLHLLGVSFEPGSWGDFVGGISQPVALLFLVWNLILQRQSLEFQQDELELQRRDLEVALRGLDRTIEGIEGLRSIERGRAAPRVRIDVYDNVKNPGWGEHGDRSSGGRFAKARGMHWQTYDSPVDHVTYSVDPPGLEDESSNVVKPRGPSSANRTHGLYVPLSQNRSADEVRITIRFTDDNGEDREYSYHLTWAERVDPTAPDVRFYCYALALSKPKPASVNHLRHRQALRV